MDRIRELCYNLGAHNPGRAANLDAQANKKTARIIKSIVRIAIIIFPVVFWRWFENDTHGWGGTILTVGTLAIVFLFMLYDGLE